MNPVFKIDNASLNVLGGLKKIFFCAAKSAEQALLLKQEHEQNLNAVKRQKSPGKSEFLNKSFHGGAEESVALTIEKQSSCASCHHCIHCATSLTIS